MTEFPIIDIAELGGSDTAAEAKAAFTIGDACRDFGFFLIVDDTMPATLAGDACRALAARLHRGFALDLGLDADYFDDKIDNPIAVASLEGGAGDAAAPNSLTLLVSNDDAGLKVRAPSGDWLSVPSIPGAVFCVIGDILRRWTNDTYIAAAYGIDDPALVFDFSPNPETDIACLPGCDDDRPACYEPVRADALRNAHEA